MSSVRYMLEVGYNWGAHSSPTLPCESLLLLAVPELYASLQTIQLKCFPKFSELSQQITEHEEEVVGGTNLQLMG